MSPAASRLLIEALAGVGVDPDALRAALREQAAYREEEEEG